MGLVVADTGPINYLILIGHIDILPALFDKVALPSAVYKELNSSRAPSSVKQWITVGASWLDVYPFDGTPEILLNNVDLGERAAIQLAKSLGAEVLLIDDRKGVKAAMRMGLQVTGTLGVLDLAAQQSLVDLPEAFDRLRRTTFRCPEEVMKRLLARHR